MGYLFEDTGGKVTPAQHAAGPFNNIHGGAAAAIMAAAAIKRAPSGFTPVSQRTDFLRSTPLSEFELELDVVREGRTNLVFDIALISSVTGERTARSTVSFYNPIPTDKIDPSPSKPWGGYTDPATLSDAPDMPSPSGGDNWMLNVTDVRPDIRSVYWFRWRRELMADGWTHWFPRLLGPADWVGGFVSPGFPMHKVGPWPNTDLTVQVDRPLEGEWIGLRPRGQYRNNGYGLGHSQLIDQNGVFGHALASTIAPAK